MVPRRLSAAALALGLACAGPPAAGFAAPLAASVPAPAPLPAGDTTAGRDTALASARELNLRAVQLFKAGDAAAARAPCERALALRERALGPDHPQVAESLNNLAMVLKALGDYAAARPLYQRALAIWTRRLGPHDRNVATGLENLAGLLARTGDYARARPLDERALAIREQALGPHHPDVALSLTALAALRQETGDAAGARPLLERALAIRERALPADDAGVAATLDQIALVQRASGDTAGARALFERSLGLRERAQGPTHPDVAATLDGLADLAFARGDTAGARPPYERALAIRERAFGPDHPDVAASLDDLAALRVAEGDPAGARPLYERALAIRARALGPNDPGVARTLDRLAELQLAQGRCRDAVGLALRAEGLDRDHFRATARVLPEREALAYAQQRSPGLDLALSFVDSLPDVGSRRAVIDAWVRARALVLDEMGARHRSRRAAESPALDSLAARHLAAATRYATLIVRGPDEAHPEHFVTLLDAARQEMETTERALTDGSASYRRERRTLDAGLPEVLAALPEGSALVSYVEYAQRAPGGAGASTPSYLAWVLRAGTDSLSVLQLGAAREVDSLVARWRREAGPASLARPAGEREAAYRVAGRALRRRIWDPLAPHLDGVARVFVVPDGALNLVSLATLPLDDGAYLLERGPLLHLLSAERDVVAFDSLGASGRGLLALGGPAFDARPGTGARSAFRGARSACGDFAGVTFGGLPGTRAEADDIARLWSEEARRLGPGATPPGSAAPAGDAPALALSGPALELTGARADERAFKRDAPGRAVLHLATHGFFFTGRCADAAGAGERGIGGLAPYPVRRAPAPPRGENPLVLSGLALAGANQRQRAGPDQEDGILTAEEIAALDLGGCQWAVLSACDTGVGEIQAGEGVFGLRRAFAEAGARTLILSLWSVDDASTRRWMRALYTARFAQDLPTAEAVRAAGLAVLRADRARGESTHPFDWGAFVAAGDWR